MNQNPFRDIMTDQAWAAWRARADRPAQEQWDEWVADGLIDQQGNVLIRMPTFGPDEDEDDDGEMPARAAT